MSTSAHPIAPIRAHRSDTPGWEPRRRCAALVCLILTSIAAIAAFPGTARAHTGFESSTPGDGAVVDAPVELVRIVFTGPATPVGEGFVALDATGVRRVPSDVVSDDALTFDLRFDPPLAGGVIGIRWEVQAPDTHPIAGSFSFTVAAPPVTTTIASTTIPDTTSIPGATGAPSATDTASATPGTTTTTTAAAALSSDDTGGSAAISLEEFLDVDDSRPGDGLQLAGRLLSLLGVVAAIGGLAFVVTTLRGSRDEVGATITAIRIGAIAVAVGAVFEYLGFLSGSDESFATGWTVNPGSAMALRLLGGVVLAIGIRSTSPPSGGAARTLTAAAIAEEAGPVSADTDRPRWDPRSSPVAFAGAGIMILSFSFDGHTVSEGPRLVHALVNVVHVAAGSIWVGGVVAMAALIRWRARRERPTRGAEMVVRFSGVATIALVAVVAAGGLMALMVLDSFGELTGTEWGRLLLLKSAVVALAACGGAYNHFRLRPALEARPDDERLALELRGVITAEAIVLTFVVVVTAWLVEAAV